METIIKPAIKVDVLRAKMNAHAAENIETFLKPSLRKNEDAIRLARQWFENGVSLSEINARLEVLEMESIQSERLEITEANEEEVDVLLKAEALSYGSGPEIKAGLCPQALDQMSTADIEELEQNRKEAHYNDTYYLHF